MLSWVSGIQCGSIMGGGTIGGYKGTTNLTWYDYVCLTMEGLLPIDGQWEHDNEPSWWSWWSWWWWWYIGNPFPLILNLPVKSLVVSVLDTGSIIIYAFWVHSWCGIQKQPSDFRPQKWDVLGETLSCLPPKKLGVSFSPCWWKSYSCLLKDMLKVILKTLGGGSSIHLIWGRLNGHKWWLSGNETMRPWDVGVTLQKTRLLSIPRFRQKWSSKCI